MLFDTKKHIGIEYVNTVLGKINDKRSKVRRV